MVMGLQSVVNIATRPTSGLIGLVVLPAHGMATKVRTKLRRTADRVYQGPRHDIGIAEAAKLTSAEKDEIVRQFEACKKETKARKWEYRSPRFRPFLTGQMVLKPHQGEQKAG
jgi:hypothetical protein